MATSRSSLITTLLAAISLVSLALPALAQEVQWRTDYTKALQEAKEKHRPILIDFGTSHCFWCTKLDATFRDATIAQTLNDQFIPLKLDADREMKLVQALRINSYPTLVFASAEGAILRTSEGFVEAARFSQLMQRVLADCSTGQAKANDAVASNNPAGGNASDLGPIAVHTTVAPPEPAPAGPEREQMARELSTRLSGLYLELAEDCLNHGQTQQGEAYLQRVVAISPGSQQAEVAQLSLTKLHPGLAGKVGLTPTFRGQAPEPK